ncbi:MAG: TonB-dependent receptor, partial [Pseudomonadales bacterium]
MQGLIYQYSKLTLGCVAALATSISVPVVSQESLALEEVLVTATKRASSLQDIAVSVAVETADSMDKKGIINLKSLSTQVPSLYIDDTGTVASIAMRGLGSPGVDSVESSVASYVDGVYLARNRLVQNTFFDLDRIEVLRGPQGTLWGKNTIAGALSIHTAKPTDEFEAKITAEAGNFNSHVLEAAVSGPIADGLAGRLAVYNTRRGAWMKNNLGQDGGGFSSEAYRGTLRWEPTDSLSFMTKWSHIRHNQVGHFGQLESFPDPSILTTGSFAGLPARSVETDIDKKQSVQTEMPGSLTPISLGDNTGQATSADLVYLNATYAFDNGGELTAITGYSDYEGSRRLNNAAAPVTAVLLDALNEFETFSQEIRYSSPADNKFSFIAGAYYEDTKNRNDEDDDTVAFFDFNASGGLSGLANGALLAAFDPTFAAVPPEAFAAAGVISEAVGGRFGPVVGSTGGGSERDVESLAVFFEGTYQLSDAFEFVFGVRYSKDELDVVKPFEFRNTDGSAFGTTDFVGDVVGGIAADPAIVAAAGLYPGGAGTAESVAGFFPFVDLSDDYVTAVGESIGQAYSLIAGSASNGVTFADNRSSESVDGSIKVQWYPADGVNLYGTVATGYKSGGFNLDGITLAETTEFDDESALAFELGAKLNLAGGAASLNIALFRTEFDDLQVAAVIPTTGAVSFANAAEAVTQG